MLQNHPVCLWRPFLTVRRRHLRAALIELGQDWREDPTNTDLRFFRNRLRHDILPAFESLLPGISRRLARLSTDLFPLTAYVGDHARHLCQNASDHALLLPYETPTVVAAETLRRWLMSIEFDASCEDREVQRPLLRGLLDLWRRRATGRRLSFASDWIVRTPEGFCRMSKPEWDRRQAVPDPVALETGRVATWSGHRFGFDLPAPPNAVTLWVSQELMERGVVVRGPCPGDRIPTDELNVSSKKLHRWLIDRKVPIWERPRLPVLACGKAILWIPTMQTRGTETSPIPAPDRRLLWWLDQNC